MSDKKKIILIGISAFTIIFILVGMISISLSHDSDKSGLFKGNSVEIPQVETEADRNKAYNEREEMPTIIQANLYKTISRSLSNGDFSGLDAQLRIWQESYKEEFENEEDTLGTIASYRGDISYYQIMSVKEADKNPWLFNYPESLAAAIAFSPISSKYQAFINKNSVLLPSSSGPIFLTKADMTDAELYELLHELNMKRAADNGFQRIAVFEMTVLGYRLKFIAVTEKETLKWQPYSLTAIDETSGLPTVAQACSIKDSSPDTDLDIIFVAPTPQAN